MMIEEAESRFHAGGFVTVYSMENPQWPSREQIEPIQWAAGLVAAHLRGNRQDMQMLADRSELNAPDALMALTRIAAAYCRAAARSEGADPIEYAQRMTLRWAQVAEGPPLE